jgi:gliding motility-associated-like protein
VTITVQALTAATGSETLFACPGSTATYQGMPLAIGSSTPFTFAGANGCDSVVTVTVQALATSTGSETLFACPGSTATYQGMPLAIGSSTPFTFAGANGCDSIVTVTVQAFTSSTTVLSESVCAGQTFSYLGLSLPPGVDTTFVFTDIQGCDSLVRVQVNSLPAAAIGLALLPSCPNENSGSATITATSGAGPFRYTLNGVDFDTATVRENLAPGAYQLSVLDDNDCPSAWPFTIDALPALAALLPDAVLPCDGAEVNLAPEVLSGDDGTLVFTWADGDFPTPRPLAVPGAYTLRISNTCETLSLQANARLERNPDSLELVYVPNAFSPNDDGVNDKFQFFTDPDLILENINFRVFDRWGALVYQSAQPDAAWTGKVGSSAADPALFVWLLEADATFCGRSLRIRRQGEVSLVR